MKNRIAKIYDLLARIPVNGDAVDVMAAVRADLRIIHNQLIQQEDSKREDSKREDSKQENQAKTVEENA